MSWLTVVLALVSVALTTFGPGAAALYVLGVRGLPLAALAPAVSTAVLVLGAVGAGLVRLSWSWPAALMSTVAAIAVAALLRRLLGAPEHLRTPRGTGRDHVVAWGTTALALLLTAIPMRAGTGGLTRGPITPDAFTHHELLRHIAATGEASALVLSRGPGVDAGRLPPNPAGWHDVVSVGMQLSGADALLAANASSLVLAGLVVPLGTAYCCAVLLPRWRWAAPSGLLAGTAFVSLPTLVVTFGTLWPFAWATSMLPALLGALLRLLRGRTLRLSDSAVALVAVAGAAVGHPTALASLVLLGTPLALGAATVRWRRRWRNGETRRTAAEVAGTAALGTAAAIALVYVTAGRPPGAPPAMPAAQAVGEAIFDTPLSEAAFGVRSPSWLLGALVVLGAFAAARRAGLRPWLLSWLVAVFAYVVAASALSEDPWRRAITSWWYDDPLRVSALVAVAGAPLTVIAVHSAVELVAARTSGTRSPASRDLWLGGAAVVVLALVSLSTASIREQRVAHDYAPWLAEEEESGTTA
ncbi:DUF6541 family protein [Modestobacter sp. SYSU DS0875]